MNRALTKHITEILGTLGAGDQEALNSLIPLVYDELRRPELSSGTPTPSWRVGQNYYVSAHFLGSGPGKV